MLKVVAVPGTDKVSIFRDCGYQVEVLRGLDKIGEALSEKRFETEGD